MLLLELLELQSDMLSIASRRLLTLPGDGGALQEIGRLAAVADDRGLYDAASAPLTT
jgi:hypothetical protein